MGIAIALLLVAAGMPLRSTSASASEPSSVGARLKGPSLPPAVSWLAAGDSYSSGYGASSGDILDCGRHDEAWPSVARNEITMTSGAFTFSACKGATTNQVLEQAGGHRFDLVTFSAGGNDLGFSSVLQACLTVVPWGGKPGCLPDDLAKTAIEARIKSIYPKFLNEVAKQVSNRGGNVVVVGYPELFAEPSQWKGAAKVGLCSGVRARDAVRIRGWAGDLNAAIGAAVNEVNSLHPNDVTFRFVNIHDGAGGDQSDPRLYEPKSGVSHNLCGGDTWLHGAESGLLGFHPTFVGHNNTGRLVADVIGELDWSKLNHGYRHRVTGEDVRTHRSADVAAAEGPRRLHRGEEVLVICQEFGGFIPVRGDEDLAADTTLWNKLDDGSYVADLFVDTTKPPAPDPTNQHPGRDPSIPICQGTSNARLPVLGHNTLLNSEGFGEIRPKRIYLGGDPEGLVDDIAWDNWGGPQATGHGTGIYVAPNQTVAEGTGLPVTVIAYELGQCGGVLAYRSVIWYFPSKGQKPSLAIDHSACQ